MMAASLAQQKSNWADDEDLDEATAASAELPPPQRLQNKDGTVTEITYRLDDQGRKVKTTRRLRHVTRREVVNPRVAERKAWAKFGDSAGEPPGPNSNTTSLADDIPFRLSTNYYRDAKDEAKQSENSSAKEKQKTANVKCRICNGEHFTARCPYKETMAPIGGEGATADVAAGMGDEEAHGGGGGAAGGAAASGKKGSYVPPALRGDRAAARESGGAGSKYGERDDLATLRVTNISEMAEEQELRDMFERFGRVTRVFLAKDRDTGMAKGFAFISFVDREDAVKACNRMDGFGYKHLILKVEFAKKAQ